MRTSARLLDNKTPFQLEFIENIADVPLTLSKNVLALWLMVTFGDSGSLPYNGDERVEAHKLKNPCKSMEEEVFLP